MSDIVRIYDLLVDVPLLRAQKDGLIVALAGLGPGTLPGTAAIIADLRGLVHLIDEMLDKADGLVVNTPTGPCTTGA